MALTSVPSALQVQKWETKTWLETIKRSCLGHAMSRGSIFVTDRFKGTDSRGDQLTIPYIHKLTGIPRSGNQTVVNNAEAINMDSFTMSIGEMRIPLTVPAPLTLKQQQTTVDFDKIHRPMLQRRLVELLDASLFNQLAGVYQTSITQDGTTYTGADRSYVAGLNTVTAPTANRILRPNSRTTDETLVSGDEMSLDLIDAAIELAESSDQPMERLDDDGFDLYLHPTQITALKRDSAGKIQWYDYALAKLQAGGGKEFESPLSGNVLSIGRYNNVNIYQATRVPLGQNSSTSAAVANTRRGVMVGRTAAMFGSPFGGSLSDTEVPVRLISDDYDNSHDIIHEARFIGGLKKYTPSQGEDYSTLVISTYSPSNT